MQHQTHEPPAWQKKGIELSELRVQCFRDLCPCLLCTMCHAIKFLEVSWFTEEERVPYPLTVATIAITYLHNSHSIIHVEAINDLDKGLDNVLAPVVIVVVQHDLVGRRLLAHAVQPGITRKKCVTQRPKY